jgi:4-hydroxybenzoate polyprenyltransferase
MDDARAETIDHPSRQPAEAPPLVVDMDGTLIRTDMLFEGLVASLFQRPWATLVALFALIRGRAAFKTRIARLAAVDIEALPARDELVDFLRRERGQGREVHLVSASAQDHVDAVAARFALFSSAEGSGPKVNLKGQQKALRLAERFPAGFAYVGDSRADKAIWRSATAIGIAGATPAVARAAKGIGKRVEFEAVGSRLALGPFWRALRPQQWAKNLLIFVPAGLSHQVTDPRTDLYLLVGFLCLSLMASATYLVNDLADLTADRRHQSKRRRPLASGELAISHSLLAVVPLAAVSLGVAFWLSPQFAGWLGVYAATTLAYSMRLKRIVMLDVTVLAFLYTLRIVIGGVIAGADQSVWLLAFSMFFFASLALTKRHSEIVASAMAGALDLKGRGYRTTDAPLTLATGVSFSAAAILIVVIYLTDSAFPSGLYGHPERLWATPIVIQLWLARLWLLAHRGEMQEDPVAFALTDRYSLMLGLALALDVFLAVM